MISLDNEQRFLVLLGRLTLATESIDESLRNLNLNYFGTDEENTDTSGNTSTTPVSTLRNRLRPVRKG